MQNQLMSVYDTGKAGLQHCSGGGSMNFHRLIIGLSIIAMIGIVTESAAADAKEIHPVLDAKYGIWLGGFFPKVKSDFSINGQVIENPPNIDFEDKLGLEESKSVLWGGLSWRISQRNNLEIEFNNLNRNGSTEVTEQIIIGDSIVNVGAKVDSTFDFSIGRLTYGYSIIRNDKMEVQLKAGLHLVNASVSAQLSGDIEVCQPGEVPPDCTAFGGATDRIESSDVKAPLPHFGASFAYAFSPKLAIRTQALGFAIKVNGIKGSLFEFDTDIIYNPWPNFGLGAGARYFTLDVSSDGSDLNGDFNFRYFGPVVYGKFTF